jgi:hypothetical protein
MTKDEILAELSRSRAGMTREWMALRREFDFRAKVNNIVRRKPYAWLSGAAALGWLLAGPKRKTRVVTKVIKPDAQGKPVVVKEKGRRRPGLVALLLGLIRLAIPIVKPAMTAYAGKVIADMARKRR